MMFVSGVAFGVGLSWSWLEDKANRKYLTWVKYRTEAEAQVKAAKFKREPKPISLIKEELKADLEEQAKIAESYSPPKVVEARSYSEFEVIDENEYLANPDFDKIRIEIYQDDLQYVLVMDGETVLDWKDVLTPAVLEQIKGQTEIYLRNHRKNEDYEVSWGTP